MSFLNSVSTYLFDMDGVIYSGADAIPRVAETIALLKAKGNRIVFVSNNATKSRVQIREKLAKMDIKVEIIFSSAFASAVYVSRVLKFKEAGKKVFVIGERGIQEELDLEGVEWVGGTDPAYKDQDGEPNFSSMQPDESIGAVLSGLDFHPSYRKYACAHVHLQRPDVKLILTNDDSTLPHSSRMFPGGGSTSSPIICSSARKPTVIGKPHETMMTCVESVIGKLERDRCVMVGDRLNTDIAFGIASGIKTVLVLTGVDSRATVESGDIKPDIILDSVANLQATA